MFKAAFTGCIDRRSLFAGALIATAAAPFTPVAAATSASSWLAYETRLRARLTDGGGGEFKPDFARALLQQVNAFRRTERLAPYQWDEGLAACARAHAADMASRDYFAHQTPEGFTQFDRASLLMRDLCGAVVENLAWRDYPSQGSTPRDFEELWETSPGHRANLLERTCTRAGYGVVKVGSAYYAAGMYADPAIQLARPLPLRVSAGAELARALDGASPHIEQLALTRPGEHPTRLAPPLDKTPALAPGVWQLRPMRAAQGARFDVLDGPVFFVG